MGETYKGTLYFYGDDVVDFPPSEKCSDGGLFLTFKNSMMGNMIETLRHEKPLYIGFQEYDRPEGWFFSGKEPVGEEEK